MYLQQSKISIVLFKQIFEKSEIKLSHVNVIHPIPSHLWEDVKIIEQNKNLMPPPPLSKPKLYMPDVLFIFHRLAPGFICDNVQSPNI